MELKKLLLEKLLLEMTLILLILALLTDACSKSLRLGRLRLSVSAIGREGIEGVGLVRDVGKSAQGTIGLIV